MPSMVLTSYENARNGGKEPEFNSLSYHGKIVKKAKATTGEATEGADTAEVEKVEKVEAEKEEWVVKIFSKTKVEDEWLKNIFGEVGWVNRRVVSVPLLRLRRRCRANYPLSVPSIPGFAAYD